MSEKQKGIPELTRRELLIKGGMAFTGLALAPFAHIESKEQKTVEKKKEREPGFAQNIGCLYELRDACHGILKTGDSATAMLNGYAEAFNAAIEGQKFAGGLQALEPLPTRESAEELVQDLKNRCDSIEQYFNREGVYAFCTIDKNAGVFVFQIIISERQETPSITLPIVGKQNLTPLRETFTLNEKARETFLKFMPAEPFQDLKIPEVLDIDLVKFPPIIGVNQMPEFDTLDQEERKTGLAQRQKNQELPAYIVTNVFKNDKPRLIAFITNPYNISYAKWEANMVNETAHIIFRDQGLEKGGSLTIAGNMQNSYFNFLLTDTAVKNIQINELFSDAAMFNFLLTGRGREAFDEEFIGRFSHFMAGINKENYALIYLLIFEPFLNFVRAVKSMRPETVAELTKQDFWRKEREVLETIRAHNQIGDIVSKLPTRFFEAILPDVIVAEMLKMLKQKVG